MTGSISFFITFLYFLLIFLLFYLLLLLPVFLTVLHLTGRYLFLCLSNRLFHYFACVLILA